MLRGHLGGRSRKGETGVGLSRSPAGHQCALEGSPSVLRRRVLSKPAQKVRFIPPYDDIAKTEGLHFRKKKSVMEGVKGRVKIEVDDFNCVTANTTRLERQD